MTDCLENCTICDSQAFRRVPSIPTYISKITKESDKKVGSLVEEYIKKNRNSVAEEKKKLKGREYKA